MPIRLRKKRGTTLIEFLVASALGIIVIGTGIYFYSLASRETVTRETKAKANDALESSMSFIVKTVGSRILDSDPMKPSVQGYNISAFPTVAPSPACSSDPLSAFPCQGLRIRQTIPADGSIRKIELETVCMPISALQLIHPYLPASFTSTAGESLTYHPCLLCQPNFIPILQIRKWEPEGNSTYREDIYPLEGLGQAACFRLTGDGISVELGSSYRLGSWDKLAVFKLNQLIPLSRASNIEIMPK